MAVECPRECRRRDLADGLVDNLLRFPKLKPLVVACVEGLSNMARASKRHRNGGKDRAVQDDAIGLVAHAQHRYRRLRPTVLCGFSYLSDALASREREDDVAVQLAVDDTPMIATGRARIVKF